MTSVPPGKPVSIVTFNWLGLPVDGFRVVDKLGSGEYLSFNVQIPLRKQAIQLGFGGAVSSESELHALVDQLLPTLDGETNW
jgi:hypothetical protein